MLIKSQDAGELVVKLEHLQALLTLLFQAVTNEECAPTIEIAISLGIDICGELSERLDKL